MSAHLRYAHVLPDSQQLLLLKAALEPLSAANAAWETWKHNGQNSINLSEFLQHGKLTSMDPCSRRLMSLVFCNLQHTNDIIIALLKKRYQRTHQRNLLLLKTTSELVQALQQKGFDVLLLKGLPLMQVYYNDLGVRPSADIDLLVRDHHFRKVCEFLEKEIQLTPEVKSNSLFFSGLYHVMHSQVFRGRHQFETDVHHSLFHEHIHDEKTEQFWQQRIPLTLADGISTHTLAPTHMLFHILAHARSPHPAVRWVADAVTICRTAGESINWSDLLTLAERYRFVSLFQIMLPYLGQHFTDAVPPAVLSQLRQLSDHPVEAEYFSLLERNPKSPLTKAYHFFYRDWLQQRLYREQPPSAFDYLIRQKNRLIYRVWESFGK